MLGYQKIETKHTLSESDKKCSKTQSSYDVTKSSGKEFSFFPHLQLKSMKSSHFAQRTKNLKNSALNTQGKVFQIFLFIFWAMRRLHIFILKFIDL